LPQSLASDPPAAASLVAVCTVVATQPLQTTPAADTTTPYSSLRLQQHNASVASSFVLYISLVVTDQVTEMGYGVQLASYNLDRQRYALRTQHWYQSPPRRESTRFPPAQIAAPARMLLSAYHLCSGVVGVKTGKNGARAA